ncbi:MAG: helix-turn-helix domain-containing protein [Candidatus Dormibacteraceae bacterium]
MTETISLGERIRWYRRRRGIPQEILAHRVGRKVDWLGKVENNHIPLDRLSVIKKLADVLDVTVGDLMAEPKLMDWTPDSGQHTIPILRDILMDYRQLTPLLKTASADNPLPTERLQDELDEVMKAYQSSNYSLMIKRLPFLLANTISATSSYKGKELSSSQSILALSYQAAAAILTKLGEQNLAWIAADRGLVAAQQAGEATVIGSLFRSVVHTLQSTGRFSAAIQLTNDAASYMQPGLSQASPEYLSVYGMLFLAGSMASSRGSDRQTTRIFLSEAAETARRLGKDDNQLWTAFGPTNVAIHRVATASELGDAQIAVDLGPQINTSQLPVERQARHTLEIARAYSDWNQPEKALFLLLSAEKLAPEQVRYHFLSRQLVKRWITNSRTGPNRQLIGLAQRLRVV